MIPEYKYIVAHGMKMVTMELIENYHSPVAAASFRSSMAGRTCVMLNNTNGDWSRLIGYYARDYEQWLDEIWIGSHFVAPRTPSPDCIIVEGNVLIVVLVCL